MLKKRLIGVVVVKNGWVVQSFGYNRYLPTGKPECLVENLDRWGADEILVLCIDCSHSRRGPDFNLLKRLSRLGLSTPLIYGGGIGSVDEGVAVIQSGADRLCFDALLHDDLESVLSLSDRLGAQALIAALPLSINGGTVEWFDYRRRVSSVFPESVLSLLNTKAVSEVLIIDWQREGIPQGFDAALLEQFPIDGVPLIAFGGLNDPVQIKNILSLPRISAVSVGNFLNYQEHTIQNLKRGLLGQPIRPAAYETTFTLL